MANKQANKGKVRIDVSDIVGKCLGKYKVVSYSGFHYDSTKGGQRLRHWYSCLREDKCERKDIQRGQLQQAARRYNNGN